MPTRSCARTEKDNRPNEHMMPEACNALNSNTDMLIAGDYSAHGGLVC
jgi:hypothetical protein